MRQRTPENAKQETEFVKSVKQRDMYECKMERWSSSRNRYEEHGIKGSPQNPLQAAHILGRPHLSPKTRWLEVIGITSCADCHSVYDKRSSDLVRVPPARYWAAYNDAVDGCKEPPKHRIPPEHPLPEAV